MTTARPPRRRGIQGKYKDDDSGWKSQSSRFQRLERAKEKRKERGIAY